MKPPTNAEQQLAFLRDLAIVFDRHGADIEIMEGSQGHQMYVESVDFNLERKYRDEDKILRSKTAHISFDPCYLNVTEIKSKIEFLEG